MSESLSNKKSNTEIKIPEIVLRNLEKNVLEEVTKQTLSLGRKEKINLAKYIKDLKNLNEDKRWYVISTLMYFTNGNKIAEGILLKIFDYSSDSVKEKIIISLTHRKNEQFKNIIQNYLENENDILQAAAIWSLAFMGYKSNLFELIKKSFSKTKNDISRLYLIAALHHLNNKPTSEEMLYLKKIFLIKYYDEKNEELVIQYDPDYNLSTEFLSNILWNAGIKIVRTHEGRVLSFYKYLLKETK